MLRAVKNKDYRKNILLFSSYLLTVHCRYKLNFLLYVTNNCYALFPLELENGWTDLANVDLQIFMGFQGRFTR